MGLARREPRLRTHACASRPVAKEHIARHECRLLGEPVHDLSCPRRAIRLESAGKTIVERVLRELPTGQPQSAPPITFTVSSPGEYKVETFFAALGTMGIRSFWSISEREKIPASQSIIIVGDRRDVQRRSIELGIRALVISSGIEIDEETIALAKAKGVSLLISPDDSATTAWVVGTLASS